MPIAVDTAGDFTRKLGCRRRGTVDDGRIGNGRKRLVLSEVGLHIIGAVGKGEADLVVRLAEAFYGCVFAARNRGGIVVELTFIRLFRWVEEGEPYIGTLKAAVNIIIVFPLFFEIDIGLLKLRILRRKILIFHEKTPYSLILGSRKALPAAARNKCSHEQTGQSQFLQKFNRHIY